MKFTSKLLMILAGGILIIALLAGCTAGTPIHGWSGVAGISGIDSNGNKSDILFVGSTTGSLVGMYSTTKDKIPNLKLEVPVSSGGFLGCAPTIAGAYIYATPVVSADSKRVFVADYNGRVYAFDTSSGSQQWVQSPGGATRFVGGLTLYQNVLYIGGLDGKVYSLDATTGNPVWGQPFATGNEINATPVADGDTLYVGSYDKSMYALNIADGSVKWHFATGGAINSTPVLQNGVLYFGSFDRYFYAVNASDGSLVWKSKDSAGKWFWASPVINNNIIYAPNFDGKVYAFNAADGSFATAPVNLGAAIASTPVIAGSKLFVATEDGKSDSKLWVIDTVSFTPKLIKDLKDLNTSGYTNKLVYAPLALALSVNGSTVVYVHTHDNTLIAFNVDTEVILWSQPAS